MPHDFDFPSPQVITELCSSETKISTLSWFILHHMPDLTSLVLIIFLLLFDFENIDPYGYFVFSHSLYVTRNVQCDWSW